MANNKNIGTTLKPMPTQRTKTDVDTTSSFLKNIVNLAQTSQLDLSGLQNFSTISQSREQVYELIDVMAEDSDIATILEAYADEACEPNENGDIIWAESDDPEVQKFVQFLLDSMNVNKHARSWYYDLNKYGDLYFKTFKESELDTESLFDNNILNDRNNRVLQETLTEAERVYNDAHNSTDTIYSEESKKLVEDIIIKEQDPKSHYSYYVEAAKNPAELFELIRQGKTAGFIEAPTNVLNPKNTQNTISNYFYKYNINKKDVTICSPMQYVHAYIEDTSSRVPEEITISTDSSDGSAASYTYAVRRGQSVLYNAYKVWRELKLLETSVLLNRLTKSSVIRILEVEVGTLPDTQIKTLLADIKSMIEQKSAINVGTSMNEYTMPGPVENTIYLPTRGEIGKISVQELGANDVDPKSLLDLDYFNNKMYGAFRVPKAFFNFTDDGAGFNGGDSLAIISSGFGKKVKRGQKVLCQGITDVINIFLLDRGMDGYINRFTIKMQTPITKEEMDRRDAEASQVDLIRDLMSIIRDDIEDPKARLEMLKILLKKAPQSMALIDIVDTEIKKVESGVVPEQTESTEGAAANVAPGGRRGLSGIATEEEPIEETEPEEQIAEPEETEEDNYLPTFDELGVSDATDLGNNA